MPQIIMINRDFTGLVSKEFIERRDANVSKDKRPNINHNFQWDAEFPEHHQCSIDPMQKLYESWQWDTIHEKYGNIDYKQFAQIGIHVGKPIQNVIKAGKTDYLLIWKWKGQYTKLREGDTASYTVLCLVKAQDILSEIDPRTNRFALSL